MNIARIGEWPSGKAPGFGPGIRGFESLLPSHEIITTTNRLKMAIFVFLHLLFMFESLLPSECFFYYK